MKENEQNPTDFLPKAKQSKMVLALTNYEDIKTISEICAEVGVSRTTYYEWLKNENFVNYLNEAREKALKLHSLRIDKILMSKIEKSDNAGFIQLYYKRIGEMEKKKEDSTIKVIFSDEIPRPYKKTEENKNE